MRKLFAWPLALLLCFCASTVFAQSSMADKYHKALFDRFLAYTQIDSQSDNNAEWMTPGQEKMADALYKEIKAFSFPTYFSKDKYIYVNIPSNLGEREVPVLGFSAHYDTTPDIIGYGIKPRVIENYDGKPIELKNGHVLNTENNPYLAKMIGKTIITSDGTTMLSGDDKAGVAILVTLLQTLADNPAIAHGPIQMVITPNEDVGRSAERLELDYYRPNMAYDFDGGVDGEIVVENFSADRIVVTAHGVNGHQSYASTNGYRNSVAPICYIGKKAAPRCVLPNYSWGDKGYMEPHHISYDPQANTHSIDFRLRYFDQKEGKRWQKRLDRVIARAEKKFDIEITKEFTKQYENVKYGVHPQALTIITNAMKAAGVTPQQKKERAGTTSAMIMALHKFGGYTVFTGQNNPHNFTEWLSVEDMQKSYHVGLNIISEIVQKAGVPAAPAK